MLFGKFQGVCDELHIYMASHVQHMQVAELTGMAQYGVWCSLGSIPCSTGRGDSAPPPPPLFVGIIPL